MQQSHGQQAELVGGDMSCSVQATKYDLEVVADLDDPQAVLLAEST